MPSLPAGLWVVATPIGNLADISSRARKVLEEADLILSEDTRRALFLFRQNGIHVREFSSFHEHNEAEQIPGILNRLQKGAAIALVSDAGTPLLADPGYRLVRECHNHDIPVHPVPGPSAVIAALSVAGLPAIPYTFLGFLPRSKSEKEKLFSRYVRIPGSLVFFERKDRLHDSLLAAFGILGEREIAICRELTKTHEEIIKGNLGYFAKNCPQLLGEITVIIGPSLSEERLSVTEVRQILANKIRVGKKMKEAVHSAQPHCPGWSSGELYTLATLLREEMRE